jgi:hypothetical protein
VNALNESLLSLQRLVLHSQSIHEKNHLAFVDMKTSMESERENMMLCARKELFDLHRRFDLYTVEVNETTSTQLVELQKKCESQEAQVTVVECHQRMLFLPD